MARRSFGRLFTTTRWPSFGKAFAGKNISRKVAKAQRKTRRVRSSFRFSSLRLGVFARGCLVISCHRNFLRRDRGGGFHGRAGDPGQGSRLADRSACSIWRRRSRGGGTSASAKTLARDR